MELFTSRRRGMLVESNWMVALRSAAETADNVRSTGMPPDMGPLRGVRAAILGNNGCTGIPKSTQLTLGTLRGGLAGADEALGLSQRVMFAIPEKEEAEVNITITEEAVRLVSERELKTVGGRWFERVQPATQ